MAEISNMILWSSSDGGNKWYQEPAGDAWYVSTQSSNYRSCYTFTYTPTTSKKLSILNFTVPIRQSGSDGGTETSGTLSTYLYIGNSPSGTAIASGSKSITFYYYEQTSHTFDFVIPEDIIITEETTFCVAVFATVFSTTYGATASVDEQNGYTVTFNSNGIGEAPESLTGFKITLPVLSATGYTFLGWSTDANSTTGTGGEYILTSDVTLYAIWTQKAFVITFDNGIYNITFDSINDLAITANDLPILEEKGKIFLGWYDINEVKAEIGNLWTSLAVSEDSVIYLYSKWDYDIVLVEGQSLVDIAEAIRKIKGEVNDITYNLSEMDEALNNMKGVNFSIVGGAIAPSNPAENTIWVNTDKEITDWGFGSVSPFTQTRDVDYIAETELTISKGYITTSGTVSSSQTASELELYIEEYFPVKYGTTYNYKYSISNSNPLWFAICEYTGSYTFSQRIVVANQIEGPSTTGTYTPSSSDITAVRFTWSPYDETNTATIKFIERDVLAAPQGAVWIKTGRSSRAAFNALTEEELKIYPKNVKQYINNTWIAKDTKYYIGGEWLDYFVPLYNQGDECIDISGGWEGAAITSTNSNISSYIIPTVTKNETSISVVLPEWGNTPHGNVFKTVNPIDLTNVETIKANLEGNAGTVYYRLNFITYPEGTTSLGIDGDNTSAYLRLAESGDYTAPLGDYSLDVSTLSGFHYVGFYLYVSGGSGQVTLTLNKLWTE